MLIIIMLLSYKAKLKEFLLEWFWWSSPIFSQLTRHESILIHMRLSSYVKHVPYWFHMGFPTRYIDVSMSQAVGNISLLSYTIFYYVGLSTFWWWLQLAAVIPSYVFRCLPIVWTISVLVGCVVVRMAFVLLVVCTPAYMAVQSAPS